MTSFITVKNILVRILYFDWKKGLKTQKGGNEKL